MCSIPDQGTRISHAAGHGQQILNIIIIFKVIFLKRNKEIKYSVCLPGSTTYKIVYGLLLLLSHSVLSNSLRPHGLQCIRLPRPSLSPRACSNSCPLSRWCCLILCRPLLLLPSVLPSIRVFFQRVSSSHQVAKVLELQPQHQYLQWIFRTDFP